MGDDTVFSVKNRHSAGAELLPAEARAGNGAYRAYYENKHGEQLIFIYDRDAGQAVLYHGDMDWEPQRVREESGVIMVPLILHTLEREWLSICWKTATALMRSA